MPEGNEAVSDNRSYPFLRSTISILELLDKVKNDPVGNEVFSENVLQTIGVNRTSGTLFPYIRCFLGDDTDTVSAVDFKARAENNRKIPATLDFIKAYGDFFVVLHRRLELRTP